jgi:hypothetical protein
MNWYGNKMTRNYTDMIVKPHWTSVGAETRLIRNVTYDGTNYENEAIDRLFATFYFYHTEKMENSRITMTFLGVLSEMGGLIQIMVGGVGLIFASWYNYNFQMAKLVEKLYFTDGGVKGDKSV